LPIPARTPQAWSLISRAKKGKTGLPKAKAAPMAAVLAAEIEWNKLH
jgi:hypothetical protein